MQARGMQAGSISKVTLSETEKAQPGTTRVYGRVSNEGGVGIPALVRLFPVKRTSSFIDIATQGYTARDGAFSLPALLGEYEILVYKGPEYEYLTIPVTLAANRDVCLDVRLQRMVNMAALGWFAGDSHQHSTVSDGKQSVAEMALADAAVGLHWAVATDHNHIEQNVPFLSACQGLDSDSGFDFLGIGGDEVTTDAGHMNVWEPREETGAYCHISEPNPDAAESLAKRLEDWRSLADQAQRMGMLHHINHPFADAVTSKMGAPGGNTFLDGDLDWAANRDLILRFDAAELWNGGSGFMNSMYYYGSFARHPFEGMEKAFHQWYNLLNTGAHFPTIGTTDCHHWLGEFIESYNRMVTEVRRRFFGLLPPIPRGLACRMMGLEGGLMYQHRAFVKYGLEHIGLIPGTPRTYVYTQGQLTVESLAQGIKAGKSFITSGPLLLATLDGKMPGETAQVGETARLSLDIRCHKRLSRLLVIVDGQLHQSVHLGGSTWYRQSMDLRLKGAKWMILYVEGDRNYAYAYTNPIYVV